MCELQFQLDVAGSQAAFPADGTTTPAPSSFLLRFDGANSDVLPQGDFDKDRVSPHWPMQWPSMTEFRLWLSKLERDSVIEFTLQKTVKPTRGPQGGFVNAFEYRCSRGKVHGQKPYDKKHPERAHKLPPKGAADCKARIYIKTYPNTPTVLGRYDDRHSHELGLDNARFTRMSDSTRMRIAELLRTGATPEAVLKTINGQSPASGEPIPGADPSVRDTFIELKDIRRIQAEIDAETRHLHKTDGESVLRWVERLRDIDTLLFFKSTGEDAPEGSGLSQDVLVLVIQSPWQRERFAELGRNFAGIDGTHNTTQYQNTTLFTIIVRDRWGHGIPVAWMISLNGTEATITFFLRTFRLHNGSVIPRYWMTDKDRAQINAIIVVYIESIIFLCWWHVLHAWQQHFSISAYPELWTLLKAWIRLTDEQSFQVQFLAIKRIAPASFTAYLEQHWMPDRAMWSAVHRTERNIFAKSDTNMLVESWHRILKHKFLQGKHNRRLDDLLHTLTIDVSDFYKLKYRRQQAGFEGVDNEQQEYQRVMKVALTIPRESIQVLSTGSYTVKSQSDSSVTHTVNATESSCTCTAYWTIRFCKHMAAVAAHYQDAASSLKFISVWCNGDDGAELDLPAAGPSSAPPASHPASQPTAVSVQRVRDLMQTAMARASLSNTDPDGLRDLSTALEAYIAHSDGSGVLPRAVPIPPNIRCTTETQAVLPRNKKSKRAKETLRYKEPYSAGVRSGTHAQPDALRPPAATSSASDDTSAAVGSENIPPAASGSSGAASSVAPDTPSTTAARKPPRAAKAAVPARAPLQPVPQPVPGPMPSQAQNRGFPVSYPPPGYVLYPMPPPGPLNAHPYSYPYPAPLPVYRIPLPYPPPQLPAQFGFTHPPYPPPPP